MANLLRAIKHPPQLTEEEMASYAAQFMKDNPRDDSYGDWRDDPEIMAEMQEDD